MPGAVHMDTIAFLLRAFDDAWHHDDESLRAVLRGVTSEEASWQHPAYARERPIPGLPTPGTILWHLAHLDQSARHYAAILERRPLEDEPRTPPPDASSLAELSTGLARAQAVLRARIAGLSKPDLDKACARGMDVGEFVRMILRHETWHAGQIAVVRRLYRVASSRGDGASPA